MSRNTVGFNSLAILLGIFLLVTSLCSGVFSQPQQPEIAGEFFGDPIPLGNYYFVLRTVLTFSVPWGGIPNTAERLEKRLWDDLLLSYEAARRGISVSQEELSSEITKMLKGHNVAFQWQQEQEKYVLWVKETLGVPIEFFENQIKHLLQLKKLYNEIKDGIHPTVTEDEAFQEFLNEYHTLSVELVRFNDVKEAEEFYQKARHDPAFWDREAEKDKKNEARDHLFQRPGFVALEFLMYMWEFPKKAVYEMMDQKVGSIYPPAPIYRGYGVFKILEIRRADESLYPPRRESYYEQIRIQKKEEGFKNWLETLRQEANVKVYISPPDEILQQMSSS